MNYKEQLAYHRYMSKDYKGARTEILDCQRAQRFMEIGDDTHPIVDMVTIFINVSEDEPSSLGDYLSRHKTSIYSVY